MQIRGLVNWLKINKDILPALSKQLVGLCKEHAVLIGKCDELFQQGIEILQQCCTLLVTWEGQLFILIGWKQGGVN